MNLWRDKRSSALLALFAVLAAAAVFACIRYSGRPAVRPADQLTVQFIGPTNPPGRYLPEAAFELSNRGGRVLSILGYCEERSDDDWGVRWKTNSPVSRITIPKLAAYQRVVVPVRHPEYGRDWRLRVIYCEGFSTLALKRVQWATFLTRHGLTAAARLVLPPRPACHEVLTPTIRLDDILFPNRRDARGIKQA